MELKAARSLAVSLMLKHGLLEKEWGFAFDKATTRLGQCSYTKKKITLSRFMVGAATGDEVEQTLLHEIAHALLPPVDRNGKTIGHGKLWKEKAASIGYIGKRTSDNPYVHPPKPFTPVKVKLGRNKSVFVKLHDVVLLPNGLQGSVIKAGRTRFQVDVNGKTWSVRFEDVIPVALVA